MISNLLLVLCCLAVLVNSVPVEIAAEDTLNGLAPCTPGVATPFTPTKLEYTPSPPVAGVPLNIALSGFINGTLVQGAIARVQVKLAIIPVKTLDLDICDLVSKKTGESCPISNKEVSFGDSFDIDGRAPKGTYGLTVTVLNGDEGRSQLGCIKGPIKIT
ncbi:hypothetical protein BKA69DRAFT_1088992 [Paraphysoderma sedebokerense]|nr:hypothetical protein BKA69DRAFT_1088992 [Paraphysoderma sedebokerense]